MDGAKAITDTIEQCVVDRRPAWAEACSRGCVDRAEMKILAIVRTKYCENQYHRKGKGSLTMEISQGLVGANQARNSSNGKEKTVNIPLLSLYAWRHKAYY